MKIRTEKDVRILHEKIKDELGIDVETYKNEEVASSFAELLSFPTYIVSWVFRPVFFSFLIYIFGFYVLNLVHVEYVFYTVIGLLLFLITGISLGLLLLLFKMKNDIWRVVNYSLDIMKLSLQDLSSVNNQITEENKKDVLSLLFKGILHVVTIPMLLEAVANKIPFVGFLISRILKKILTLISDKLEFDEENIEINLEETEGGSETINSYIKSISSTANGLELITNVTFKIARFPILLFFIISVLFLILFLYIIN